MTTIDDLMRYARLARFGDTASITELRAALKVFAVEQHEAGVQAERDAHHAVTARERQTWLNEHPDSEGRDVVTPFDQFLYSSPIKASAVLQSPTGILKE